MFGKSATIRIPVLPAQTIKVWCDFLSKSGVQIVQIVTFFLTYTKYAIEGPELTLVDFNNILDIFKEKQSSYFTGHII